MENIHFQIQDHRSSGQFKQYVVIFLPKINYESQVYIDEKFAHNDLEVHNLPIDLIPLDYDLLTLEQSDTVKDLYVKQDTKILSALTRSIVKLETVFGRIKHRYAKGDHACSLVNLLQQEENSSPYETDSEILAGVFIDRSIDFVTPFCTNKSYEGLIDEYLEINFNTVILPPELLDKEKDKKKEKMYLDSNDSLYHQIRDANFDHLRSFLPEKLESIRNILEDQKRKDQSLQEMSENLKKLKEARAEMDPVVAHINIADYISNILKNPIYTSSLRCEQLLLVGELPSNLHAFFENQLSQQENFYHVVRLMCLESLVFNGFKGKILDSLKRDFLLVFILI